ncbi:MAG: hypothetical protein LC808_25610 [Actinobacteria bacterium]|nr:hypothetical protein [Actinomycetota bacterium]
MIIVDDHLAILAVAGALPDLGPGGPVATTYSFHYRMARAVSDSARLGSLSRRLTEVPAALSRVLRPPAHRLVLVVLDPRASIEEAVMVALEHSANLLLAELVGAAVHHGAAVRVTPANQGKTWPRLMQETAVDFATVRP